MSEEASRSIGKGQMSSRYPPGTWAATGAQKDLCSRGWEKGMSIPVLFNLSEDVRQLVIVQRLDGDKWYAVMLVVTSMTLSPGPQLLAALYVRGQLSMNGPLILLVPGIFSTFPIKCQQLILPPPLRFHLPPFSLPHLHPPR